MEYLRTLPESVDLVGRYQLIAWQSCIPADVAATKNANADYSIELHADGTFTATNVPRALPSDGSDTGDRLEAAVTGQWHVDVVAGTGEYVGGADGFARVQFTSDPTISSANLMHGVLDEGPPYRLVFVLGDRTEGDGLTFRRIE